MKKFLVIVEKSSTGWEAYAPDLPGVGVVGKSVEIVKRLIKEAIEFHIESLREHGEEVPEPTTSTTYVEVAF